MPIVEGPRRPGDSTKLVSGSTRAEKELGWTIWDAADEGEGYVTEAARATREHVYRDLGWETAVSYIHLDNARSIAVAERLGCVRDDAADSPGDDGTDLVYRHPAPGSLT